MRMPETYCSCKSCRCKDVCEFYEDAVRPVIKTIEEHSYDLTNYATKNYLNGLKEAVEKFYCDQYE